jgi:murein DD-endopeptidase MepM/ murein hydrolase activator NlpD
MRVAIGLISLLWMSTTTPSPTGAADVSSLRDARLTSPMPGGILAGYAGDTGLDIAGTRLAVRALAAGTVEYAEWGHTRWRGPKDTAYCVRIALDTPIAFKGHTITHVYYAHMSALAFEQKEGATERRHVAAGESLGTSGVANGSWHLHLGLLLDGHVEQDDWTYILREDDVRAALGGYKPGEKV